MLKRIMATIGLIIIFLWIAATIVTAIINFPLKSVVFPVLAAGCVLLPIMLWIILWMISFVTGKKNIATEGNPDNKIIINGENGSGNDSILNDKNGSGNASISNDKDISDN